MMTGIRLGFPAALFALSLEGQLPNLVGAQQNTKMFPAPITPQQFEKSTNPSSHNAESRGSARSHG